MSYNEATESFLDEQFGEDLDILESFLITFKSKYEIYSQRIKDAIDEGNIEHVGELCHEVKGIVSNLGPSACLDQVKNMELKIKSGAYDGHWDGELFEKNLSELLDSVTSYLDDKGVKVA